MNRWLRLGQYFCLIEKEKLVKVYYKNDKKATVPYAPSVAGSQMRPLVVCHQLTAVSSV